MPADGQPRTGRDYDALPPLIATANQLVAYNIAYWRQVHGMTQEELGILLQGYTGHPWSKATVSAAERSWDGKRVRRFDADELLALAEALAIPLAALFLPPTDDGIASKLGIVTDVNAAAEGEGAMSARDLMYFLIADLREYEDGTDEHEVNRQFSNRVQSLLHFHFGQDGQDLVGRLSARFGAPQNVELRIADLRLQQDVLRQMLGEVEREAAHLASQDDRQHHNVAEQINEHLLTLRQKIDKALLRPEVVAAIDGLRDVSYDAVESLERTWARELSHELRHKLTESPSPNLRRVGQQFAEAIAKASDYRTPWFRLAELLRAELRGPEEEFANRMADRLIAGEDPAAVARSVDLSPAFLRMVISRHRKLPADIAWPAWDAPWGQPEAVNETAGEPGTSDDAEPGHSSDTPREDG